MHGGKSTGCKTESGRKRISERHWKHGAYSREQIELRARLRKIEEENRTVLAKLKETCAQQSPPRDTAVRAVFLVPDG
jgi:hypothetical protein